MVKCLNDLQVTVKFSTINSVPKLREIQGWEKESQMLVIQFSATNLKQNKHISELPLLMWDTCPIINMLMTYIQNHVTP